MEYFSFYYPSPSHTLVSVSPNSITILKSKKRTKWGKKRQKMGGGKKLILISFFYDEQDIVHAEQQY